MMDTPFERLDVETRREWRQNPTTLALIKTLAALRQDCVDRLVDAAKAGRTADNMTVINAGADLRAIDLLFEIVGKKE